MADTWIMAKAVGGGPIDGIYFAVVDTQETIVGMNNMTEDEQYVKDENSVREFLGQEAGLATMLFHQSNMPTKYCEFVYSE